MADLTKKEEEFSGPLAEISHGPSAFEAFLDRNTKGLVIVSILLAIAGGVVIVMRELKEAAAEEAGSALTKAATVTDLQAVAAKFPDSPASGSARLLLADKQWSALQQDEAIQTLRDFLAKNPGHPAIASAKAGLATRLLQQDKSGDAEPLFRELANDPKAAYLAPYANIALGDIQKAAGKLDEAEASYKKAQENTGGPMNPFGQVAAERARLLHFKAPAEIEPPRPPAAPPLPAPGANGIVPEGAELPDELKGPMADFLRNQPAVPPTPIEDEPAKDPAAPPSDGSTPPPAPPAPAPGSNPVPPADPAPPVKPEQTPPPADPPAPPQ